ncbi:MAG: TonB-dependent receptor [Paludibacter sp.]|nr:TonB-dependent receptor [Paludibacter sp.]
MKKITILFAISYAALQLNAQSNFKDSVHLNEVLVTGSKIGLSRKVIPLSVSQISKHEIEQTGEINILPALNTYIPGVFVTQRNVLGFGVAAGGSGAITMRGIGGAPNTEVLVLIDGHPQYQGIFGHPLADAYVASDVEKVEVIRGPGSLLYGSNAMGGVINIITRKNDKQGLSGNIGASYGSFNTQKYYGTLGFKKDKLSVFASVNHDQTDGTRANTDFKITNGYTKVGYEINKHFNINADFNIADFKANDNGPSGPTTLPKPFNIDIQRSKTALSLENKYENSEGALKLYHNFGEHTLSDGFHSTDRNSGAMLYQSYKFKTRTLVTVGTDFKQYGGTVNQTAVKDSLITLNEVAAYVYAQQELFDKFTISAGLRADRHSKLGTELIPMGGISYYPSQNTTLKASVSKGFRNPTLMELYLYAPNPNLAPERMMNYELSWLQSLLNNKLKLELTFYKVKGDNLIQVVAPPVPAKRQNVGSFDNKGFEFSGKFAVSKAVFIHANYSYLDLKKPVVAAPRQQLNISTNYKYKIWDLNVGVQYIEQLYTAVSAKPTVPHIIQPEYLLLNARVACTPIKNLQLFVAGNNLLNKAYQINNGYPMPGINFNGGVNYRF